MTREELKLAALSLPYEPGVYLMKNAENTVIYVGKAKKLKNRVSQYFQDTASHSPKTRRMVSQVDHFETIRAATEFEALVLECSLIKHYMPKYNILLKDDKGYPYIRLDTRDAFPRMTLASRVADDGALYFGPYGSRGSTKQLIDNLCGIFRLPICNRVFPRDIGKGRPCLNRDMKLCDGWCSLENSESEYRERMQKIILLLQGKHKQLLESLRSSMEEAAERLDFEAAAEYRDRLKSLEALSQKQLVTAGVRADTDVFGWYQTEAKACLVVLHFVGGNLLDKDYELLPVPDQADDALSQLLLQYYLSKKAVPKRIYLPMVVEDADLIAQLFSEEFQKTVKISVPQRGDGKRMSDLANQNAKEEAERATTAFERINGTLRLLQSMLQLPTLPLRMEAFDISNTAGTDIVASMTVFVDGKPLKRDYKRFKVEGLDDQDDYASMRQVVSRRFCHYLDGDKGFDERPDVLLIDGGITHAEAVREILTAMGIEIPIFGMVKDDRHRTRALVTADGLEIGIQANPSVFALIGRIQEETHRFAITYHRTLRSKRVKASELDEIKGIGEKRKIALLKHFKSLTAIRNADISALRAVVPQKMAEAIFDYFHKKE